MVAPRVRRTSAVSLLVCVYVTGRLLESKVGETHRFSCDLAIVSVEDIRSPCRDGMAAVRFAFVCSTVREEIPRASFGPTIPPTTTHPRFAASPTTPTHLTSIPAPRPPHPVPLRSQTDSESSVQ